MLGHRAVPALAVSVHKCFVAGNPNVTFGGKFFDLFVEEFYFTSVRINDINPIVLLIQNSAQAVCRCDGLEDILDEDVPLADGPKTGSTLAIFGALSSISGLGLAWVGMKKKSDEK